MKVRFHGDVWYWRGPSPFHFVTVPEAPSHDIHQIAALVTYGWGVIPCVAEIGGTTWRTSLIPKDDAYLVPIKAAVRVAEGIEVGDRVAITLTVGESLADDERRRPSPPKR